MEFRDNERQIYLIIGSNLYIILGWEAFVLERLCCSKGSDLVLCLHNWNNPWPLKATWCVLKTRHERGWECERNGLYLWGRRPLHLLVGQGYCFPLKGSISAQCLFMPCQCPRCAGQCFVPSPPEASESPLLCNIKRRLWELYFSTLLLVS